MYYPERRLSVQLDARMRGTYKRVKGGRRAGGGAGWTAAVGVAMVAALVVCAAELYFDLPD